MLQAALQPGAGSNKCNDTALLLSDLPLHIGHHNKREQPELVLVGYAMKASREKDLADSKMLCLRPQVGARGRGEGGTACCHSWAPG